MQIQKQGYKIECLGPRYLTVEIPNDWGVSTFDSMVSQPISYGILVPEEDPDGIPMIRSGEIDAPGGIKRNLMYISKTLEVKYKKTRIEGGEILMALVGATIGQLNVAPSWCKGFNVSRAIAVIKFHPQYLAEFYAHFLRTESIQRKIKIMTSGSAQPVINLAEISKFKVPVPKLNEQQKIVFILSKVDELIQKTDQIIEQTQRLKKGLMQRLLTKGIGHTKFKKIRSFFGKHEEIPEEWRVVKLGDVVRIRYGLWQPPKQDEKGIPMIRATNIKKGKILDNGILRINASTIPKSTDLYLQTGEVIVVRSGAYTGDVGRVTDKFQGTVAGYDLVVSPTDQIRSTFLTNYLLSSKVQDYFSQLKSRVAQSHLNAQQLSGTIICLPTVPEQYQIDSLVSNIDNTIDLQASQRSKINTLKNGLMQKLLTGKLRVKV